MALKSNCRLFRVYLNRGGYDAAGFYWGLGMPLFCFIYDDGILLETDHLRGSNRVAAKAAVLRRFPNARFFS